MTDNLDLIELNKYLPDNKINIYKNDLRFD